MFVFLACDSLDSQILLSPWLRESAQFTPSLIHLQHNCDPRFFTTVVFYVGSVFMATRLKFEVFDVFNRREHKMNPIGQAQCQVKDLLMSVEQVQRLEILYDEAIYGYLTVRIWWVSLGGRGRRGGGINGCDGFRSRSLRMLLSPTSVPWPSLACRGLQVRLVCPPVSLSGGQR